MRVIVSPALTSPSTETEAYQRDHPV